MLFPTPSLRLKKKSINFKFTDEQTVLCAIYLNDITLKDYLIVVLVDVRFSTNLHEN